MSDLLRNLRGSARPVALLATTLLLASLWPLAEGRGPNPALLIIAGLLFAFAVAVWRTNAEDEKT